MFDVFSVFKVHSKYLLAQTLCYLTKHCYVMICRVLFLFDQGVHPFPTFDFLSDILLKFGHGFLELSLYSNGQFI